MKYLVIQDAISGGQGLAFDLRDVLGAIGDKGNDSVWRVSDVEASGGESALALESAADSGRNLTWTELRDLARGVVQVIDGVFIGRLPGKVEPWLIIRAVDSSAYDIESNDEDVLRRVRSAFKDVKEVQP
jgi:hypothetical protein